MTSPGSFEEWLEAVVSSDKSDPLWRMSAYRFSIYALEWGWTDLRALQPFRTMHAVGDQLYRALGSVAANIAEGYSRSSGPDRARLFEYALGFAREARVWYRAAAPVLTWSVARQRIETLNRISRILLSAIPTERQRRVIRDSK